MNVSQNTAGEWSVLSFDTDRIKKYIFATSKLKEIRGASALLDDLNREIPVIIRECGQGWGGDPVVYAAGGSCTAIVPSDRAKEIIARVERMYLLKTLTASITGVSFHTDSETITNHFGLIIKELGRLLQDKKAAKFQARAAGTPGYVKFCESCSIHPAQTLDKVDGTWLCDSCRIKREAGVKRRHVFWDRFSEYLMSAGKNKDYVQITSIDQLAEAKRYLGFISCDGNNMGKFIESLHNPRDFALFASGIDRLISEVTFGAISELVKPIKIEDDVVMPYEIFLMGGDDLVMAVPASVALDVTVNICKEFEKGSRKVLQGIGMGSQSSLSLGAGVVIGPVKYPFQNFNRLAEQLQKSAKRKCAETGITTGVIDYQVVTGSGLVELEDIRKSQLAYAGADSISVSLTMRPYFTEDVEKILSGRDLLRRVQFPKSRLNKLYDQLFVNRQEATLETAMAVVRSKKEQASALKTFLKNFDAFSMMPWTRDKAGNYCTPLGDLVEIFDI